MPESMRSAFGGTSLSWKVLIKLLRASWQRFYPISRTTRSYPENGSDPIRHHFYPFSRRVASLPEKGLGPSPRSLGVI